MTLSKLTNNKLLNGVLVLVVISAAGLLCYQYMNIKRLKEEMRSVDTFEETTSPEEDDEEVLTTTTTEPVTTTTEPETTTTSPETTTTQQNNEEEDNEDNEDDEESNTNTNNKKTNQGLLGNINWDELSKSNNGPKFYFNEQTGAPNESDRLQMNGVGSSGSYRLPGSTINQTDYTGSTNVFSPIINMNKNVGESFTDNPYDGDNFYHI